MKFLTNFQSSDIILSHIVPVTYTGFAIDDTASIRSVHIHNTSDQSETVSEKSNLAVTILLLSYTGILQPSDTLL